MKRKVIIATKNKGKAKEFERMLSPKGYDVLTLLDFPDFQDIDETGETFEENAVLKAEEASAVLNEIVIADDSGLIIDALDGRPGVYSARYAGEAKDDNDNMDKVLTELKGVPYNERTARFYCVLAIAGPDRETRTYSGACEGKILDERRGTNGFGYDPIFFVEEKDRAMAELTSEEKSSISHRGKALKQFEDDLEELSGDSL
ncbi:XTP/dITP diphosphatase [Rossellomorea vietnamensis]|uniref:dITP/XTP pyrophosphatase n=2 Tax=Bacillaceae TaxID=186817 RepID=A0A5D4MH88_9BACI|nr:XTP/dITP diphosphatase [Rossellomorea vietnamensis]TYS01022.1 XTP/dITP diphosphatase [Rossellomorea vietnamensis]